MLERGIIGIEVSQLVTEDMTAVMNQNPDTKKAKVREKRLQRNLGPEVHLPVVAE